MSLEDFVGELLLPFRSLSSALTLLTFALLLALISAAGLLGLWLMVIVMPALFRYLVSVAESRAEGHDVDPPGIEYFTVGGHLWALFPIVPTFLFAVMISEAAASGPALGWMAGLGAIAIFPAIVAVLVITHSPLQSMNPLALARFAVAAGPAYLYAPPIAALLIWPLIRSDTLPGWLLGIAQLYLAFVFYAVTGALIREKGLLGEIDIPDLPSLRESAHQNAVLEDRAATLNHAYALASRGNSEGAFRHLEQWIEQDPEPADARAWYFEHMLAWEDKMPALLFARRNLGILLEEGKDVPAVKLMLRCRLVNDAFRPLPEHLAAAVAAARRCGNDELAESLEGAPSGA